MEEHEEDGPCEIGSNDKCVIHGDYFKNGHRDDRQPVCDWYAWMFGCDSHPMASGTYK